MDYYIPMNTGNDFPKQTSIPELPPAKIELPTEVVESPREDVGDYFPASALSNSLTKDYVLRAPKSATERNHWVEAANTIRIGAWFEGTSETNKGTVFIDGIAYRSGEIIEREYKSELYLFRFEGVKEGQILITSLKREVLAAAN